MEEDSNSDASSGEKGKNSGSVAQIVDVGEGAKDGAEAALVRDNSLPIGEVHYDDLADVDGEDDLDEKASRCSIMVSEYSAGGTRINGVKIAERVHRQRGNQARRKKMSKRNLVKDAEKHKLKVEVQGSSSVSG